MTRHPFLWGLALWAVTHLTVKGDAASLILFGSLLVLCLGGTRSIDAKRRRTWSGWERFAAVTSNLPFQAILEGRNRFSWAEIGWLRAAAALLAYVGMLHAHARLFGVAPLP